jgi:hypothetical protein
LRVAASSPLICGCQTCSTYARGGRARRAFPSAPVYANHGDSAT